MFMLKHSTVETKPSQEYLAIQYLSPPSVFLFSGVLCITLAISWPGKEKCHVACFFIFYVLSQTTEKNTVQLSALPFFLS